MNVASFVLCGCPIVAKTAIPTSGAAKIVDIAIRFWDCLALSRNQKLFPHFREARTSSIGGESSASFSPRIFIDWRLAV